MKSIKLFICCHQFSEVPKHPLLVPIQVGTALSDIRFSNFLYDDVGNNISIKNRSYCELTAQYWAWKNVDADYYGFFHYRRYLYPDILTNIVYRIEKDANLTLLKKLGYDDFPKLILQNDILLPKGEDMRVSVRKQYTESPFHHAKDLNLMKKIIENNSPEYIQAMEEYLSNTVCYFGNIFIMKREVFFHYCNWLFFILEKFDQQVNKDNYNTPEKRVDGYLAERMLGIYITKFKEMRIKEIPRVHFVGNVPELYSKRLVNFFFPPGSRQRSIAKKIVR